MTREAEATNHHDQRSALVDYAQCRRNLVICAVLFICYINNSFVIKKKKT